MQLEASKESIEHVIKNNNVVVFSKTYCPYCTKAKVLLNDLYPKFICYELDTMSNGDDIKSILQKMTNQSTVPNIFIAKKHIGGCDSLFKLHQSGELNNILNKYHSAQARMEEISKLQTSSYSKSSKEFLEQLLKNVVGTTAVFLLDSAGAIVFQVVKKKFTNNKDLTQLRYLSSVKDLADHMNIGMHEYTILFLDNWNIITFHFDATIIILCDKNSNLGLWLQYRHELSEFAKHVMRVVHNTS